MTRRERLEAKLQKREEWAESRRKKADSAQLQFHNAVASLPPFGEPIKIGHHSEKRHRAAFDKCDRALGKMVEHSDMANHHASKAGGLADQLDSSIYSDDPDAIEAIQAKVREIDAECARMVACNKAFKKSNGAPGWAKAAGMNDEEATKAEAAWDRLKSICPYEHQPYPAYALSNRRANARRLTKRIGEIEARNKRQQTAEDAGGVLISRHPDCNWASVTFSEKPSRDILIALKEAGYRWGGGRWSGYLDKLPPVVAQLA